MCSSEVIFKKKLSVLHQFFNILNTFFVKHGKKQSNFFVISNFLFNLKTMGGNFLANNSGFFKFYNFISRLTPRIDIVSVENKKAGKVFKIPMPPLKNNLLQHNFLVTYARTIKNNNEYRKFSNQLTRTCSEFFINEKGDLNKQKYQAYDVLKEHKFRAKKRHDKIIKMKKNSVKNAFKKSKQFYL